VENHTSAAAPREKETADFLLVREAYEKATGNRWNRSDSDAYVQNGIANMAATQIASVIEAVVRRTLTKINSFKNFVKEITAQPDPRNRAHDACIESIALCPVCRDLTFRSRDYEAISGRSNRLGFLRNLGSVSLKTASS
jgi:hypothetical protein